VVLNKSLFSSNKTDWETPDHLLKYIVERWKIDKDIAPANPNFDALAKNYRWEGRLYCNPPYGKYQIKWIRKCMEEFSQSVLLECVVFLLPARTDTGLFKLCWDNADEIIFLQGRIRFKGAENSAPFPSMLVVFNGERIFNPEINVKIDLLSIKEIEEKYGGTNE